MVLEVNKTNLNWKILFLKHKKKEGKFNYCHREYVFSREQGGSQTCFYHVVNFIYVSYTFVILLHYKKNCNI